MRLSLFRGCSAQLKLDARVLRELNGFKNYWNRLLQDDSKLLSIKQGEGEDEMEFLNPLAKYNPIFFTRVNFIYREQIRPLTCSNRSSVKFLIPSNQKIKDS